MERQWKNKTVLVTGGAKGIGAAIVKMLAEEGVKYIAVLDIIEDQAKALQEELNAKYKRNIVHFHKCDLSVEDQISAVFKTVVAECGYIDVVINNAGILNDSHGMFRKEIEINYTALVSISLKALALMRKDEGGKGGTIINVASVAALKPAELCPIYSGTKSAVLMFSLSLGGKGYYKRTAVRVMTMCFGSTKTTILDPGNFASFDKHSENKLANDILAGIDTFQSTDSAARGVSEAYKKGESASTWLVHNSRITDITATVNQAYSMLNATLS